MPTRMLRDWCDSEPINALSAPAERFFTRLIMKADDYGRQTANPKLLRPMMFPLLLNEIREADVQRWIAECVKSGLVRLYEVDSKSYLEIIKFDQRMRAVKSKFPDPRTDDGQVTGGCQTGDGHPRPYSYSEAHSSLSYSDSGERDGDGASKAKAGEPAKHDILAEITAMKRKAVPK